MANTNIKGITIEIGGNTSKLEDALKGVNKTIYSTNSELKLLNQALKFDPHNVELLAQKQDVLRKNIEATTQKLNTLKEAQRQMGDYNSLTDEQKETYRKLGVEIAKSEAALGKMNEELKNSSKIDLSKLKEGLKKVGNVALEVSKAMLKVTAAIGGALAGLVTAGVKSYAELEKAQKGAEALFGESFNTVKQNAAVAYKSLGLSATEYYDQVNTYAVGLKNALNGDTEAAARLSNSILNAQADIVAATGADQQAVQNAFSAVMRGNYTMLDNLRLGIKGSKEGMQEVIDKVNEWNKANGKATKYQMGNYADMQQALVDYVEMQGIAGTAQERMAGTISGSITQMKSAFDNFLNGSGSPAALSETILNVLRNISTAIQQLDPNILDGVVNLVTELLPQVVSILFDLLPKLLDAVTKLIDNLLETLRNDTDGIANTISTLIEKIVEFITDNLPKIIEAAILIIEALVKGITNSLPTIINSMINLLFTLIDTILDNLPDFILAGIDLIIALAEGLIDAIPKIVEKIPIIIDKLVTTLTNPEMILKMVNASIRLMVALAKGLIQAIPELLKVPFTIIKSLVTSLGKVIDETDWGKLGSNIIKGICDGFGKIGSYIKKKVTEVKDEITNKFKSIFGIHSPSKLMRDTIGLNITAGIGEGIEEGIPDMLKDVNGAMRELTSGVEASVNPTINPSVNTSPLIINIGNFNNTRSQDVQAFAHELELYRRNLASAKGGV